MSLVILFSCQTVEKDELLPQKPDLSGMLPFPSKVETRIHNFFNSKANSNLFNGAALFRKGNSLFVRSYGKSNFGSRQEINDSTAFQLASASKPLTAIVVMSLIQEGVLSLEDKVEQFYSEFPVNGITIEMLLSHRSGLPNYMYISDDFWEDKSLPMENQQAVDSLIKYFPGQYFPVNKRYDYSNTNYMLLAAICEKATEKSFDQVLEERIFGRVGMDDTRCYNGGRNDTLPNTAIGYTARKRPYSNFYLNGCLGDKGVYATTTDLLKLDLALNSGVILDSLRCAQMHEEHSKSRNGKHVYGLGWRIKQTEYGKLLFHNGWWRGFRSYFLRIPEREITIVILSNSTMGGFLNQAELLELI